MAKHMYIMPLHFSIYLERGKLCKAHVPKYGFFPQNLTANHPESIVSSGKTRAWFNGFEAVVLISFLDITQAEHDAISAKNDVIVFPDNLDDIISAGDIGNIKTRLRIFNIPDAWVGSPISYRQLARNVMKVFNLGQQYMELFNGTAEAHKPMVESGESLLTKGSEMAAGKKARMQSLMTRMNQGSVNDNASIESMMSVMVDNLQLHDGKPYPLQEFYGEMI